MADAKQRTDRERANKTRDQAKFGVGFHELVVVAYHAGDQGGLRHRVGLLHHQRHEHQRVQQDVVGVKRHEDVQHCACDCGDLHHHLATARNPVDSRPDQRGNHHEWREAHNQVPKHRRTLRVGTETEHLARNGAIHGCVTDGDERMGASEPTKWRLRVHRAPTITQDRIGTHSVATHSRIVDGAAVRRRPIRA